ncbi:chemotaxis protein CheW [Meridianimarinicoccus roseus]|uniref:Chemotaxis protein CheW n=1 Tax=Meridianimarinicoccus roseus TaxID=2072018 RepID=A0A2V2LBQ8_9RHOB|nr:chemotaxis protein CheW [Meridianimarinicoccus roseus]PWR01161.1 chemotaxis protein CheW [Meridianimarinicoccus roseus]
MLDEKIQTEDRTGLTYLTCGLEDDRVGLPVTRIKEILDARPIRALPHTPPFLLGYVDVRGESILVADLRKLLGRPFRPDAADTRIVVLLIRSGDGEKAVGLRTDCVYEVATLDNDRIMSFADLGLLNWDSRMVRGIGKRNGEDITLLNLDGLMNSAVLADYHEELPGSGAATAPSGASEAAW